MIAYQKGRVCVLKWKDKKPSLMLSTVDTADFRRNKYER